MLLLNKKPYEEQKLLYYIPSKNELKDANITSTRHWQYIQFDIDAS